MTDEMKELYQGYLKADKENVAAIGKQAFESICKRFVDVMDDEKTAFKFALSVFGCFVAEDGGLDNHEWAMLEYILQKDMSRETVLKIIKDSYNESSYFEIKAIIDNDDEMKHHVIVLGLCICAIDGNVDEKENQLMCFLLN